MNKDLNTCLCGVVDCPAYCHCISLFSYEHYFCKAGYRFIEHLPRKNRGRFCQLFQEKEEIKE